MNFDVNFDGNFDGNFDRNLMGIFMMNSMGGPYDSFDCLSYIYILLTSSNVLNMKINLVLMQTVLPSYI